VFIPDSKYRAARDLTQHFLANGDHLLRCSDCWILDIGTWALNGRL
jgi:hypothetical protein